MEQVCGFCGETAVVRIFARHGREEGSCERDLILAMRTIAEGERVGETLHVEFLDGTGYSEKPHDD